MWGTLFGIFLAIAFLAGFAWLPLQGQLVFALLCGIVIVGGSAWLAVVAYGQEREFRRIVRMTHPDMDDAEVRRYARQIMRNTRVG